MGLFHTPSKHFDRNKHACKGLLDRTIKMKSNSLLRLQAAHEKVANLVMINQAFLPIFVRLEAKLAAELARSNGDAVAFARAAAVAHGMSKPTTNMVE